MGVKAQYELTPSICVFSVTFKTEEFLWVERFYDHLKKCFKELKVEGWDDFTQYYDYDVESYVSYSLICCRSKPISLKSFRDKKKHLFLGYCSRKKK